jgi:GNAT superfamily N-acetyltransferase
VAWLEGAPAGYFELRRTESGDTEIVYFGLIPERTGQGWGKQLLTRAVRQAWADGARRVWLHTCTLDSPHALPNYRARGFVPFREERYVTDVGDPPASA